MKIGVVGCNGRVGKLVIKELLSGDWDTHDLVLAGGSARTVQENNGGYFITDSEETLFEMSDVIIDFTLPEGTRNHAKLAAEHNKTLIVGTTGLTLDDEIELKQAAEKTTIIYAANMSVGVNLLLSLVEKAAACLDHDWDIEIFESHHKYKVDAPSGTALAIGKAAATGRNNSLENLADYDRHGQIGVREKGKIGFSVARGGDVVGEHTAFFFGNGERIELTHKATDRKLFAKGALHAALWSEGKSPGLYSMRDVLDL
ncbi:MAG: 4-hydroxy-tetrahydrodipicolinate reductase [Zetaproteobacteria bacterium]|nr:MAG: 4-hydroxy-tetrahydrodipicolinate reductase [Zetaproteobacteria bacterium]